MTGRANAVARNRLHVQSGDGFGAGLAHFADKLAGRSDAVFDITTDLTLSSIRDGSAITGAPGQPVDDGDLYRSWRVREVAPGIRSVESTSPYARIVEYNIKKRIRFSRRKKRARSIYGRHYTNHGPYSMSLTRAGFVRIVEVARQRAIAANP